jgi:hypothetical protein
VKYPVGTRSFALHAETRQQSRPMPGGKEEGNQKNISRFRYRDSPKEIQGAG